MNATKTTADAADAADWVEVINKVAHVTGVVEHRVEVAFGKEAPEDGEGYIYTVRIVFTQARSRKGFTNTAQGWGSTAEAAAEDAIDAYDRAVESGMVAKW